jgi:hypothetical protein
VQAYMGHRQVMNTVRYTAVDAERFRSIWDSEVSGLIVSREAE